MPQSDAHQPKRAARTAGRRSDLPADPAVLPASGAVAGSDDAADPDDDTQTGQQSSYEVI